MNSTKRLKSPEDPMLKRDWPFFWFQNLECSAAVAQPIPSVASTLDATFRGNATIMGLHLDNLESSGVSSFFVHFPANNPVLRTGDANENQEDQLLPGTSCFFH
ncbi:uncharacterized protein LOC128932049 [Callithrix jacchus]|uniref:uncharacterized protein LOC128932049 isoform X2 n=1 Tax=Callithrix jacchus TaxID=9483 RepID=UPI0023DD5795|nr:uncharacterized protein LOC128932049 isoform X2 [Callithrix jacchus]